MIGENGSIWEKPVQRQALHHKSHKDYEGLNPGFSRDRSVTNRVSHTIT